VTFEVGITFCTGRNFKHGHDNLAEAMADYTAMLAVGIEPSLATELDASHIRMVTFLAFDELGEVTQHITSPIFECEDQAVA
jgi:hypothetical protein